MLLKEYAYAKINLHLEILNKRDDGYHNILSIMARTGLFDLLKLDYLKIHNNADVNLKLSCRKGSHQNIFDDLPIEKNLIYKAALAYFKKAGQGAEIKISIEKNIPAGAGLGGGSADAAAVLRLLNREKKIFSEKELHQIAMSLGADVPFCLGSKAAICEGIGEKITPVNMQLKHYLLIANNGTHVDTKLAYDNVKKSNPTIEIIRNRKILLKKLLQDANLAELKNLLKNDFEEFVFKKYPSVKELKDQIVKSGADFTIMTGSGSTIIGLFQNKEKAYLAQKGLLDIVSEVHIVSFQ